MSILSCRRLLTGVACAVAACSDAGIADPGNGVLTTDATRYTATSIGFSQVSVTLVTQYSNRSDTVVVLPRCTPTSPYPQYHVTLVDPLSAEGAGYNPDWACVGHNQHIVIPANSVRTDTLMLRGPTAYDSQSRRYIGVLAGTFRVTYGGQTSNTFTIQMPPAGIAP